MKSLSRAFLLMFLTVLCASAAEVTVSGRIMARDEAVPQAVISILSPQGSVLASTKSDSNGEFTVKSAGGSAVLNVSAPGFAEKRLPIQLDRDVRNLVVDLNVEVVKSEVTVTADPGRAEDVNLVSQGVNIIGADEIAMRAKAVLAQAVAGEEGVHLQRTSATVGGIFVRGLTGNKVNVFVDGVRYSTSAARGGINTFLNLISPENLEAIEVLRGPSSAQYGSDALGGSVQLLGKNVRLGLAAPEFHGAVTMLGSTADLSAGSNLTLTYSSKYWGWISNVAGRRVNNLRTGNGIDSHSAFTRFFGLRSDRFITGPLRDTDFTQYGGSTKVAAALGAHSQLTGSYSRGQQDGGRRADQLLGGDGNLVADLRNLMNDLAYLRLDHFKMGWVDHASITYSYNAQREERVNQGGNGNARAAINHEYEKIRIHGVQGFLDKRVYRQDLLFGGEYYHERMKSPSHGLNPLTGVDRVRRGRVPDNALYQSGGIYLQDSFQVVPEKLRLIGSVRYSVNSYMVRAQDSPLVAGARLWPDDGLRTNSVTFRVGSVFSPVPSLTLNANFSTGFRAPHMTDLGTVGLTGSGFEVAASELIGRGALVGTTASASAVSTGRAVAQLKPETSREFEVGAKVRKGIVQTGLSFFLNNIAGNITKQALILPAGAVGTTLGGEAITAQNANGVVFVGLSASPVLVNANFDDARLYGFEQRLDLRFNDHWSAGTVFTYIHSEDVATGLAPNIEGGTPAPDGYIKLRYTGGKGRWFVEPNTHVAARQERLSTLDLEDRRTGATRTRSAIQNFFRNGATARGFIAAGPDGIFGNADDTLIATGETLPQIQDRVLGVGVNAAPLYTAVPGYGTFNVMAGVRVGERHNLLVDIENITGKTYRGISWGIDAPGRNLTLRYTYKF